jgi:hypothetical protein
MSELPELKGRGKGRWDWCRFDWWRQGQRTSRGNSVQVVQWQGKDVRRRLWFGTGWAGLGAKLGLGWVGWNKDWWVAGQGVL